MDNSNTRTTRSRELTEQQKQKLEQATKARLERIVTILKHNSETRAKWTESAQETKR